MRATIVYFTKTGHTRMAAEDIAEGLRREGVEARLVPATELETWDVAEDAVVVVGSPCYAGALRIVSGIAGPVRSALKKLAPTTLAGKVGGAFSVHCSMGGGKTVRSIEQALRAADASVPEPGVVVRAGAPLSLFTGRMASDEAREQLRNFGRALAKAARSD